MSTFHDFSIPDLILESLEKLNFSTPTPIQAESLPHSLLGKDILGSAQTGSGKTVAFSIPLIAKLLANPKATALVITPTRELAAQVAQVLKKLLGRHTGLTSALLIGGDPVFKQIKQLRTRPRVVVGTPGRINDHLLRGTLDLSEARFLVLDETDRMLDMGFSAQINQIMENLPEDRQTLLFSATMPKYIEKLAQSYLKDPVRIAVGNAFAPAENIKHDVVYTTEKEKYAELLKQLQERSGSVIIFVKTKIGAEKIADELCNDDHNAEAMHADLSYGKRKLVIQGFRFKKHRILVATDVAARGLDIPHIEHVINYDLPQCPEDYLHRIGRTARAGAEGAAVCFVTKGETKKWQIIDRLMNPKKGEEVDEDKVFGRQPMNRKNGRSFGNKRSSDFSFGKERSPRRGFSQKFSSEEGSSESQSGEFRSKKSDFSFDKPRRERRSFEDGNSFDRPRREKRPFEEGNSFDKPKRERRSFEDGNSFDRPRREKRPFEEGNSFDRPRREKKSFQDDFSFDRPKRENRSFQDDSFVKKDKKKFFKKDDRDGASFNSKPSYSFDKKKRGDRFEGKSPSFSKFKPRGFKPKKFTEV